MIVFLDNIIFNLQKEGDDSVRWANMIRGLQPLRAARLRYIEYANAIANVERFSLDIARRGHLYTMRNLWLTRHLAVRISQKEYTTPFVFHSSGYRVCDNPNAVNIITLTDSYSRLSVIQHMALKRCDRIICHSRTASLMLPRRLRKKATVISARRNHANIAKSVLTLYRQAIATRQLR